MLAELPTGSDFVSLVNSKNYIYSGGGSGKMKKTIYQTSFIHKEGEASNSTTLGRDSSTIASRIKRVKSGKMRPHHAYSRSSITN